MTSIEHLVIGGGIAGLATAYHLAACGAEGVVLLERGELGSQASTQNAAILRSFGTDALARELARRSSAFLHEPPEGFGKPFVERNGVLLLGDAAQALAWRAVLDGGPDRDVLRSEGVTEVAADEVRRLAPHARSEFEIAVWCPNDGHIDIRRLLDALARNARAHGVDLRTRTGVRRLLSRDGQLEGCELDSGERLEVRSVVLAAGGWAGPLGATGGSAVELRPTRRHLGVTSSVAIENDRPTVWSVGTDFYHRPETGGLLVCVCDQDDVDPDRLEVDPAVAEEMLAVARREVAGLEDITLERVWSGVRTLARGDGFQLGPDPLVGGLYWVAGLGGHGMSCGLELGRRAAEALLRTGNLSRP